MLFEVILEKGLAVSVTSAVVCDPAVLQDPVVEGLVSPKTIRHPSPPFNKDEPGVRKLTGVDREEFTAALMELRDNVFSRSISFPQRTCRS